MSLTISLSPTGTLIAEIPGTPPHSVEVPFSLSGLAALRAILEAQGRTPATIGFSAAPSQAMVNAFLESHKVQVAPAGKTAAQIIAHQQAQIEREERAKKRLADLADLDLTIDL